MWKARPSRQIVRSLVAAAIASASLDISIAQGMTFYWDSNGTAAGVGGNGSTLNWSLADWTTNPTGVSPTVAWPNTSPNTDTAVFMTSAGTLNIDSGINVNSMVFQTANYVIAPSGNNYLNLSGTSPTIAVNLPVVSGQTIVTISAPISGSSGFTLDGNNGSGGGLKFLQLANTSATNINNFSGPLVINAAGAMRLGGGSLTEQIGDNTDMTLYGVIDFASNSGGKVEKLRNVTVSGPTANFSASGGTHFIVNSLVGAGATGPAIALNGNNTVATQLTINGWADGNATLTLNDGTLRFNGTGGSGSTGSKVNHYGDILASGNSFIWNQNGGGAGTATTNTFTFQDFNFLSTSHTINVAAGGTLTISSAAPAHPVVLTSPAGGTTLIKTGAGTLAMHNAIEHANFSGTNEVREGTWLVTADNRLGPKSDLLVSGGTFQMQTAAQTVSQLTLTGGWIVNSLGVPSSSSLRATSSFDVRSGFIDVSLLGAGVPLVKSTAGTVVIHGTHGYTGATTVNAGTLSVSGKLSSPTLTINAGTVVFEGRNVPNDPDAANRFSSLTIATGATLDLRNNAMVLDYSSVGALVDDIRQDLQSGRIMSRFIPAAWAIGYGDNQVLRKDSFAGMDVSGHNNVLLKYTYAGDANLDGQVDIADLYALASSWRGSGPWTSGDFNYDGVVNAADLGLLSLNWQAGVGNPAPGAALDNALLALHLPDVSSTPEPAGMLLLGAMTTWSLKRSRRARTLR
jgi:autotransporter-associated beta strand protein